MCYLSVVCMQNFVFFFFFNDTATTEIYTLSLHDALPIWCRSAYDVYSQQPLGGGVCLGRVDVTLPPWSGRPLVLDRKSTRLNSSHANISYAVFCLKKKKIILYTH